MWSASFVFFRGPPSTVSAVIVYRLGATGGFDPSGKSIVGEFSPSEGSLVLLSLPLSIVPWAELWMVLAFEVFCLFAFFCRNCLDFRLTLVEGWRELVSGVDSSVESSVSLPSFGETAWICA